MLFGNGRTRQCRGTKVGSITKPKVGLVALCLMVVWLLVSSLPAGGVNGGTEVDAATFTSDWSFVVGVGKLGAVTCTGSLVDVSTVITAGHCADPSDPPDTVYYGSPDYTAASTIAIASIDRSEIDQSQRSVATGGGRTPVAELLPNIGSHHQAPGAHSHPDRFAQ